MRGEILQTEREDRREHDRVEESDQYHSPHGSLARHRDGNAAAHKRARRKKREQLIRRDALHRRRTRKSPNHKSEQMPFEVVRRDLLRRSRQSMLHKTNHKARDANLGADIKKLSQHSADQMLLA